MEQQTMRVASRLGLHARPATDLVNAAKKFKSAVAITKVSTGQSADAKSILKLLSISCAFNDEIILNVDGEDEKEAMAYLSTMIKDGLL